MTPWHVRPEQAGDETAITALTEAAFRGAPHSDGSEAAIVERLRADGDLALSLVLVNDDQAIVGHAAFSPVTISDGAPGWYGLGPVSVIPLRQRAGLGSALVEAGLEKLREAGARGCVVLGDPAYYGRFGFRHDPRLAYPGPPAEFFQVNLLGGPMAEGRVSYAPAFG
jgi:putative acetyltransferase